MDEGKFVGVQPATGTEKDNLNLQENNLKKEVKMEKTKVLFVCYANIDRSPTAEQMYSNHPDLETKSAGIASFATVPVSAELVQWADVILTMDEEQKQFIKKMFPDIISNKTIDSLGIINIYTRMHPKLQDMIRTLVDEWLRENLKISPLRGGGKSKTLVK